MVVESACPQILVEFTNLSVILIIVVLITRIFLLIFRELRLKGLSATRIWMALSVVPSVVVETAIASSSTTTASSATTEEIVASSSIEVEVSVGSYVGSDPFRMLILAFFVALLVCNDRLRSCDKSLFSLCRRFQAVLDRDLCRFAQF